MARRKPTADELAYVNANIARKQMGEGDMSMIDFSLANSVNQTCYGYFLGDSTIFNFKNNLAAGKVPLQINHRHDLPLGTWLPGNTVRMGDGYALHAPLYMPNDLELGGYNTGEIGKAIDAGTLSDASVGWAGGEPICDVCGNDIRDAANCPHLPGRALAEGETNRRGLGTVTFTLENGHLNECSVVWKAGLPGSQALDDDGKICCELSEDGEKVIVPTSWEDIKKVGLTAKLSHSLSVPIGGELALSHNSKLADNEPPWGSIDKTKLPRNAFAGQGEPGKKSTWSYPHHWVKNGILGPNDVYKSGDMFLHRGGLKAAWDMANGARSGQNATPAIKAHLKRHMEAIGMGENDFGGDDMTLEQALETFKTELAERFVPKDEFTTVKADLDKVTTEKAGIETQHKELKTKHDDLTKNFSDLNAEVEENKHFVEIGKERVTDLTAEYHRLGTALRGEKWDKELEDEGLNALAIDARAKLLVSKIGQMKGDLFEMLQAKEVPDKGHKDDEDGKLKTPTGHRASAEIYKV